MENNKLHDQNYNKWYEEFYPRLTGCGTWLKGHEINTLAAEEWPLRNFRVLFARLSTYNDVSSSFTHLLLYQTAKELNDVFPDIAYLPNENDARVFEKHNIPWLLGTQTKLGAKHFSMIGFSNSIVQEIINIPRFLETSGLPLKRAERLEREDVPLIILGGANSPFSASIWGEDALVDGVFTGCDSNSIKELLRISADGLKNKKRKSEILAELEGLSGFSQTFASGKQAKKGIVKPAEIELLKDAIVPYHEEAMGTAHLQISEGCRAICSFCAENWTRKPYRELGLRHLVENALVMKAEMAVERLNIFSFNFNMYSRFYELLWELAGLFHNISFKSQRFDMLSESSMIECQLAALKTTFSAALEGISARLRRYLNKNLNENVLKKALELIFKLKIREIKIFLLSTGLETDDDFKEFENFLDALERMKEKYNGCTRVVFSITPLVKFPWTPLEFDDAAGREIHEKIVLRMKKCITFRRFEAREAMDAKEYLVSQILVRASDERIKRALISAIDQTGFVYYARVTGRFFSSFLNCLQKEGLKIDALLKGSSYEESLSKSWSGLEMNINRKALWDIFQKNRLFMEQGGAPEKTESIAPAFSPQEYKKRFSGARTDTVKLSFLVNIKKYSRGLSRKYIGLALARAIMKSEKALVPHFRRYLSSWWAGEDLNPFWVEGDDIITLEWLKGALKIFESKQNEEKFISSINDYFKSWGSFKGLEKDGEVPSFRLRIDSPYEFDASRYFKQNGLKYTLYKGENGLRTLAFSRESLKKNIINSCSYTVNEDSTSPGKVRVSLEVFPAKKFKIEEFVKDAFLCPGKNDRVRIRIISYGAGSDSRL